MTATPIVDAIPVIIQYEFEGNGWLETSCLDYDHFRSLPAGLTYKGRLYGRSGWNSDRHVAYYTTRQIFALPA